jgi:uncharacterized membrane protein YbaN (DUF454 family)
MESNVNIDVANNTKVNRCPLGPVLNPSLNEKGTQKTRNTSEHSFNSSLGNRSKVMMLKVTGILFVGLAILGVALPILPTTPFLLVAAACFAKSSPEMQKRLLANKTFGPLIHDWQKYRSIPRKAKRIALLTMVLSVCWSAFMLKSLWLTLLVVALVTGPFIFLWRLPLSK